MKLNNKGFTLIELLAVIAILSVLIVLVYPVVSDVGNSTKKSLKESKIKTIVAAAEKYGNSNVNDYQRCNYLATTNYLENNCLVPLITLGTNNYIEYDNANKDGILDPTNNQNLTGQVLICYNNDNSTIYGTYIDSSNSSDYSCNQASFHSLTLSSHSDMFTYQNNSIKNVDIISLGNFTSYECLFPNGLGAFQGKLSCNITNTSSNPTLNISYQGTKGMFPYSTYQTVNIKVIGKYVDSNSNVKELTDNFNVYIADLISEDAKTLSLEIENYYGVASDSLEKKVVSCFQNNSYGCQITLPYIEKKKCYNSNGYSATQGSTTSTYNGGELLTLIASSTAENGIVIQGTTISKLFNNYAKQTYNVTYISNATDVNNKFGSCNCDENFTPNETMSRSGYNFGSWSPNSAMCNSDLTFTANWTEIPRSSGGSSGSTRSSSGSLTGYIVMTNSSGDLETFSYSRNRSNERTSDYHPTGEIWTATAWDSAGNVTEAKPSTTSGSKRVSFASCEETVGGCG